jgi:hypothetical protein
MMWLGEMYWKPARPPRDAVSIDILQQITVRKQCANSNRYFQDLVTWQNYKRCPKTFTFAL